MLNTTILIPAYGKQYPTLEAAKEAWISGKDFSIKGNGQYCSIRDLAMLQSQLCMVYIYLYNLRQTIVVSTH